MRLIHAPRLPFDADHKVFAYSPASVYLLGAAFLVVPVALAVRNGSNGWGLGGALFAILFSAAAAMALWLAFSRRSPENWLLAVSSQGVLVRLRSFDAPLPSTEADVAAFDFTEITGAAEVAIVTTRHIPGRADLTQRRYLELELGADVDTRALAERLRLERVEGSGQARYGLDYPVALLSDGRTLRLEWSSSSSTVRPRMQNALEALESHVAVHPPRHTSVSYSSRDPAERTRLFSQLAELALNGHGALVYSIASSAMNCSPAAAQEFLVRAQQDVRPQDIPTPRRA